MLFRSNDTATTEIYTQQDTLSLHDALPISLPSYAFGYYARDNAFYQQWEEISRTREGSTAWIDTNVMPRPVAVPTSARPA